MLEQVLQLIHNWFVYKSQSGTFTIEHGVLNVPAGLISDSQYFRIIGSVFNDGLHRWPTEELHDETFCGYVQALAIPEAVLEIAGEIADWQAKYGEVTSGPYQSESFSDYSYTKATSGSDSGGEPVTWQSVFRSRLSPWRKIG